MHRPGKLRALVLLNHQPLHRGLKRIVTLPWQYGPEAAGTVTRSASWWSADDPKLATIHTDVTFPHCCCRAPGYKFDASGLALTKEATSAII
jgi:hypothetical protein